MLVNYFCWRIDSKLSTKATTTPDDTNIGRAKATVIQTAIAAATIATKATSVAAILKYKQHQAKICKTTT